MLVCIVLYYRTSQLWDRVLNIGGSHRLEYVENCQRKSYSLSKKSRADEDDKIISHREIMHKESLSHAQRGRMDALAGIGSICIKVNIVAAGNVPRHGTQLPFVLNY